jgi:hypothetical protein
MGCPVVGPNFKKHQQKIDDLLSLELATKFEAKLLESGLGLKEHSIKKHFSLQKPSIDPNRHILK